MRRKIGDALLGSLDRFGGSSLPGRGSVERAYLTGIEELRDICKHLSSGNQQYRIVRSDEKEVTILYNDHLSNGPTSLSFSFPILSYTWPYGLPGPLHRNDEASRMVCLHVLVGRRTRQEAHPDGGEIWKDGIADWERFWPCLEAALNSRSKSRS